MLVATSSVAVTASMLAIVTSGVFAVTMLRSRSDPTTRPLIGVAFTLLLGAVVHLAVVDLAPVREALGIQWGPTVLTGGFWLLIAFDLQAVVSGFWFLFALQYTGRDRDTSPIAVAVVAMLHAFLSVPTLALSPMGASALIPNGALNVLLGSTVVLAESLAVIGVFFVLASTLRHKAVPVRQTGLLTVAVGTIVTLPFAATTMQDPILTPMAITITGLLFTTTIRRYRLFETLPVASVIGRDRVVDEMTEGVVMIGRDGSVQGLNQPAEALLDVTQPAVVGKPLTTAVPSFPDPAVVTQAGSTEVELESGQIVAITADTITDDHGRKLGSLLVCRDVTEQRHREHRLGVLTQLLAGVIQEKMAAVATTAAAVVDGTQNPTHGGDQIHDTATTMATLVARVRDVERALAAQAEATSMVTDLSAVVPELQAASPADVSASPIDSPLFVVGASDLVTAILELLTMSAATEAETLSLRVEERGDLVTVEIAPFELGTGGTITDIALQISRLATEHAEWSVTQSSGSATASVEITLPVAEAGSAESLPGGEDE